MRLPRKTTLISSLHPQQPLEQFELSGPQTVVLLLLMIVLQKDQKALSVHVANILCWL
jgi:hypothetical protein